MLLFVVIPVGMRTSCSFELLKVGRSKLWTWCISAHSPGRQSHPRSVLTRCYKIYALTFPRSRAQSEVSPTGEVLDFVFSETYKLPVLMQARILPIKWRATATIAFFFPALKEILSKICAKSLSTVIAFQEDCTKIFLKMGFPWRLMCPWRMWSPEECSEGVSPT